MYRGTDLLFTTSRNTDVLCILGCPNPHLPFSLPFTSRSTNFQNSLSLPPFKASTESPPHEMQHSAQSASDHQEHRNAPTSDQEPPRRRRRRLKDRSKRTMLSIESVIEIFERRPKRSSDGTFLPSAKLCRDMAEQYGAKIRTIRDIWNRKSWADLTLPLCTPAEVAAEEAEKGTGQWSDHVSPAKIRPRGRPKGSKDSTKRKHPSSWQNDDAARHDQSYDSRWSQDQTRQDHKVKEEAEEEDDEDEEEDEEEGEEEEEEQDEALARSSSDQAGLDTSDLEMIANCSMAHLEPFSCPTSWVQSDDATHSHLASTPQEDCSGFDEWHTVPLPSFVQSWQDEAQHQHDAVKGRHWKSDFH